MTGDTLDPRTHAYRTDLAAAALEGRVQAERYTEGSPARLIRGRAALNRRPKADAPIDTELLFGERVTVLDEADGWAWVQNETDSYVGYLPSDALGKDGDAEVSPSHRVYALRTFLYPEPDLKTPALDIVSMTSSLTIRSERSGYGDTGHGWIWLGHLKPADEYRSDLDAIARAFIGTPYLWGGRSSIGLDCSAFVQICLAACGTAIPRDTDQQEEALSEAVGWTGDEDVLQPGDLVFWKGHVGLWIGPRGVIHANATDMAVSEAPLSALTAQILETTGEAISSIRRPPYRWRND